MAKSFLGIVVTEQKVILFHYQTLVEQSESKHVSH